MKALGYGKTILLAILVVFVVALCADAAFAGPGGIIKAATRSRPVQIGLVILTILLAPIITWFLVKRAIQIRRTRNDLAALAALHPQYRWLDVKDRVTETFNWVWSAWTQQKMELASAYTTHWYWQNQQLLLDDWAAKGLENVCRVVAISQITPLFVQHVEEGNGERSRLVVDITARVIDYLREKNTGKVVQGDEKEGELETIWTFMWVDGAWRLNLIEAASEEFTYLWMPNEVPANLRAAPQQA
jgi:hypothetical protein